LKTLLRGTGSGATKHKPGIDDVTADATQLYGELEQADASPTKELLEAAAHVEAEGKEVLPGWEEFRQNQLPTLNSILRNANRPAINLDKTPNDMPSQGDED
jgi:hypothetical protein